MPGNLHSRSTLENSGAGCLTAILGCLVRLADLGPLLCKAPPRALRGRGDKEEGKTGSVRVWTEAQIFSRWAWAWGWGAGWTEGSSERDGSGTNTAGPCMETQLGR